VRLLSGASVVEAGSLGRLPPLTGDRDMTITELAPLRTERERALLELLTVLADAIDRDGIARHEYAVQTLARATRQLTPGAAATLGDRSGSAIGRRSSLQVVSRVLARCGDEVTRHQVSGMLARYASAPGQRI
jgi:hypothetical protein